MKTSNEHHYISLDAKNIEKSTFKSFPEHFFQTCIWNFKVCNRLYDKLAPFPKQFSSDIAIVSCSDSDTACFGNCLSYFKNIILNRASSNVHAVTVGTPKLSIRWVFEGSRTKVIQRSARYSYKESNAVSCRRAHAGALVETCRSLSAAQLLRGHLSTHTVLVDYQCRSGRANRIWLGRARRRDRNFLRMTHYTRIALLSENISDLIGESFRQKEHRPQQTVVQALVPTSQPSQRQTEH